MDKQTEETCQHLTFGFDMSSATPSQPDPAGPSRHNGDTPVLMERVYQELRAIAADYMRRERPEHTLQPTALVHEAYLRLAELDQMHWRDRTHFVVAASGAIRRVLVDHARGRNAQKRGGGARRLTLSGLDGVNDGPDIDLLALDEALHQLAELDERKARVVELRFFGGLTIANTAEVLGVGTTTIEDDWAFARSWLRRLLGEPGAAGSDS